MSAASQPRANRVDPPPRNFYSRAARRRGREAEGTRLLNEHTPNKGIEGSNPSVSAIYTQPEKRVSSQRVGVRPKSICPRFVPADAACGKPGREGCSNLSAGSEGQMPLFASPTATRRAPGRTVRVPRPTSGMRHRGPRADLRASARPTPGARRCARPGWVRIGVEKEPG